MSRQIEVDLVQYSEITKWSPKIGDLVFKDGGIFRWCAVICGINQDTVHVKKAGNPALLFTGDYKEENLKVLKIKNTRFGSYFVVSDGIYYV